MKVRLLLLIFCVLSLAGCGKYGKGETVGYVYAVDDGIFWDSVWIKSSLEASESDCYLLKNDMIKQSLKDLSGKQKVKFFYDRHLFVLAANSNDEITEYEILY